MERTMKYLRNRIEVLDAQRDKAKSPKRAAALATALEELRGVLYHAEKERYE